MTRPDPEIGNHVALSAQGSSDDIRHDAEFNATWTAFVAEAEALVAADLDSMTPAELERLDQLGDPVIHLYGAVQRLHAASDLYDDSRLLENIAEQERVQLWCGRVGTGHQPLGPLSDQDIRRLSRRALAAFEAERLGVRAVDTPPPSKPARPPAPVSIVLDVVERTHEAPLLELSVAAGEGRALWDADCDAIVALPPDVPRGRYVALRVTGDSMEPLLHAGDVALVRLGPSIVPNTVIVAQSDDEGYVVKRVGHLAAGMLELLSLNRAYAALWIARRPGRAILGTVVLRWCPHGVPALGG